MKIYIACDHRGVELKKYLIESLKNKYDILDSTLPNFSEDDYPDFAFDICTKMDKITDLGILICGTGIGISIAANKVKGIRCARVNNLEDAKSARVHNHANVLAMPASLDNPQALEIAKMFIETAPSSETRHVRRVNKIISYEEGTYNEL